jgi:hypothetical protein
LAQRPGIGRDGGNTERQRGTKGGGHGHDTQYPSPAEQDAGGCFIRGKPDLQSIGM